MSWRRKQTAMLAGLTALTGLWCVPALVKGGDAAVDAKAIRARVPNLEPLRKRWEEVRRARGIAGLSIVVVQGEDVIYSETLGERNPETHQPVTMDSMFYIASCTKSYMALGIMTLVEEGKVSLDDPVKKYLPRFELSDAKATATLTIRDLLSHAKGLDSGEAVFLDAFSGEITEDRYYHWLRKSKPSGSFDYTNVHYTLLGRVAEAVTGQSWKEFLKARIFEPSGMYHTTAYASEMYGADNAAIPCDHNGTSIVPCAVRKTDRVMHAAGGLGTSAADAARWLKLNINGGVVDGKRIISEKSLTAMHKLQAKGFIRERVPNMKREGYGFGWFVGTYHGKRFVEHGGGYAGTSTTIGFMPEYNLGVAVLANGSSSLSQRVAATIYDELLDLERGNLMDQLEASCAKQLKRMKQWHKKFADRPVTRDSLSLPASKYAGRYYTEHWGAVTVKSQGDGLSVHLGDLPLQLLSAGKDKLDVSMMPGNLMPAKFVLDGSGGVSAFVYEDEDYGEISFARQ